MRILAIADFFFPFVVGGSAIMAYELMREMVERGHEVTVLTRAGEDMRDRVDGMDMLYYRFAASPTRYPLSVLRAVQALRQLNDRRFDLVNMHHASGGIAAEIYKKLSGGPPTVFFFQGPWHGEAIAKEAWQSRNGSRLPAKYAVRKSVDRAILRNCDALFCLSDYMYGEASAIFPHLAAKYHKLSGGVNVERFAPVVDRATARRELALDAESIVLLTVRRLDPRMGLENLVRAMAIVGVMRPDVVLLIGGKGQLQSRLRELIAGLNLENVRLLGYIDDEVLPMYYQASNLFVMPTETMEGYGLSTLEALACGLPVLGTDVGATPEILSDLLPDFIASGTEPQVLAENILRCLPLLRGVDGRRLRRFAEARSWARVADRVEAVFEQVAKGWGPAA